MMSLSCVTAHWKAVLCNAFDRMSLLQMSQNIRRTNHIINKCQSNLTEGRIAAAHGRFSLIRQVASMCIPYIVESQKRLLWQRLLEPRNRLCFHRVAWPRKPTPRMKQGVASYHTTEVIAHRSQKVVAMATSLKCKVSAIYAFCQPTSQTPLHNQLPSRYRPHKAS